MNNSNSTLQIVTRSGGMYGKYNTSLFGYSNDVFSAKKPSYDYKKLIDEYRKKEEVFEKAFETFEDTGELPSLPPPPKLTPTIGFYKWMGALKTHWDNKTEFEVLVSFRINYNFLGIKSEPDIDTAEPDIDTAEPDIEVKHILYHESNKINPTQRGNYWCITQVNMFGKMERFIEPYPKYLMNV